MSNDQKPDGKGRRARLESPVRAQLEGVIRPVLDAHCELALDSAADRDVLLAALVEALS